MTAAIIIITCTLLLIAYLFDLSASRTRIPAVLLLLALGWGVGRLVHLLEVRVPDLSPLLPVLGTLGLILIVLEGSLELEFNRTKLPIIRKTLIMALVPVLCLSALFALLFSYYSGASINDCLLNAIPIAVISSSIAIPSVRNLDLHTREFVIYESSLSDIIGILLFNFVAFNAIINLGAFGRFALELIGMAAISFAAAAGLAFLLNRIDHHIKFAPIIILVILVYEISKVYNLPALMFILLLGLFLGNLDELKRFKWIQRLGPSELNTQVHKLKDLVTEATFLVRTLFFILFGYLMNSSEIMNPKTIGWAVIIVIAIFITRAIMLWLLRYPLFPLVLVAPRGLINILLFLSIPAANRIDLSNKSLIVQVIVITALRMMAGVIFSGKKLHDDADIDTGQLQRPPE